MDHDADKRHDYKDHWRLCALRQVDRSRLRKVRAMSRDANRIPKVLAALGELWAANPDLRLGQIMGNAAITYYTEDDKALQELQRWSEWCRETRRQA